MNRLRRPSPWALSLVVVGACGGGPLTARTDGLDAHVLPTEIQTEYGLFQDRCSKCHSLARALNSGIDTDEYWDRYVERMRRMPGSGISIEDTHVILRFLYYYAAVQRQAKATADESLPAKLLSVLQGRGAPAPGGSAASEAPAPARPAPTDSDAGARVR